MKTLFFGTPALAVPYLERVAQKTQLLGVVTTPDEPAGRGYALQAPPVKQAADKLRLPVLQPEKLKDPDFLARMRTFAPELVVVVAYGKILPSELLKVPTLGYLNVHFSLLPAYRGAAPIQRALMQGEKQTGVTLFWLDEGMDTGPIFLQRTLPIADEDDAESLREKLIPLGVEVLQDVLNQVSKGSVVRNPQTGTPSLAPTLKKEEGKIDWTQSAAQIANLIRGTTPWPGAYTLVKSGAMVHRLKILKAKAIVGESAGKSSEVGGVIRLESGKGFVVKCGQEFLQITSVQPEGKRPMSAWDYWQGAHLKLGEKIG